MLQALDRNTCGFSLSALPCLVPLLTQRSWDRDLLPQEREAEQSHARAKEHAAERRSKEAAARKQALEDKEAAQARIAAAVVERARLEAEAEAAISRVAAAKEGAAKASAKAAEAKRLERTEAALLQSATPANGADKAATDGKAVLSSPCTSARLELQAYREQQEHRDTGAAAGGTASVGAAQRPAERTTGERMADKLAATRKRAEERRAAAAAAAAAAVEAQARLDGVRLRAAGGATGGEAVGEAVGVSAAADGHAQPPVRVADEQSANGRPPAAKVAAGSSDGGGDGASAHDKLQAAKRRAEQRRAAAAAAAEAARRGEAPGASDHAAPSSPGRAPSSPSHAAWAGNAREAPSEGRAAAVKRRAEEQRSEERAAAEAAEAARQRAIEQAAARREQEAKRKLDELAAKKRAAEKAKAARAAQEASDAAERERDKQRERERAAAASAAAAAAAAAAAGTASPSRSGDRASPSRRGAAGRPGGGAAGGAARTAWGAEASPEVDGAEAEGAGRPSTARERKPSQLPVSNPLARAKAEADAFLAAKQRLANEARERREARDAETRQQTRDARLRKSDAEAAMAAASTDAAARAAREADAEAQKAQKEAKLVAAAAAARAASHPIADSSVPSEAVAPRQRPQSATARPVGGGGGGTVPVAVARPLPPPVAGREERERPSTATAATAAPLPAAATVAAADAAGASVGASGAGSVARRLAAAKANPQLSKTLDPNSPLADNYSLLGVLGKGSYGEVRLAIHKLTKLRVAVKTLSRAKLSDDKLRKRAAVEVKLHQKLRHAHIARLYEVISSPAAICLCMQYAPGGTLRDVLDQHGALAEGRARRYMQQMCGALHYCHRTMHVVHRDLKLDNLLLDGAGRILLADFGFAEYVGPSNKRLRLLCGSPHYSAPEIFAQQEYSGTAADMWSLGVLLYTMLSGFFPFQAESMEALGKKVMKGKPDKPLRASDGAVEVTSRMLVIRSSHRADIDEVCTHGWLAPTGAEAPLDVKGVETTVWDESVATRLEGMGCPTALVQHHVASGVTNHVTAAYEMMQQAERAA